MDYSINKILRGRHYMRGHAHYHCSNPSCTHENRVHFSCKDRGCSACGKIARTTGCKRIKNCLHPAHGSTLPLPCPKP
ncbi:transposase zinc-binding domain-containing protein (plasmid) [Legionella lytica]|uniref:Transposase zinc-binding domain-containing protein n=1 Tax=Legionella lytica TaxID=96232 RepID=A0ABY4YDR3_9GAMM|nr:transposase zinc-binding domain-containing protein [Legionella lytica]USQ15608.1 transposase zinc-binding domain-containing protein [Legionella lytica]